MDVPHSTSPSWMTRRMTCSWRKLPLTHGGPGTVIRSLVHGVPLLCMPMGRDQHDNTARVAALGADLTVDRNWGLNRSATAASFPT